MCRAGLDEIDWPTGWHPVEPSDQTLADELEREVGKYHPLFGVQVIPIARREDRDDVLFLLPEDGNRLAEVHLTWAGGRERDPQWPSTVFFESWEEWLEQAGASDG